MRNRFILPAIFSTLLLNACMIHEDNYAPVTEISIIETVPKTGKHRVLPDETLYSIAWRYGLDYQDIAERNHISPPYHIKRGQWIYLTKSRPMEQPQKKTIKQPSNIAHSTAAHEQRRTHFTDKEPSGQVAGWSWPARGPIIGGFSSLNKGINIAGDYGDPIFATAPGKVVYSGNGLRGYGNLIIIKHNKTFLTAYAHNSNVFVHNGDWVTSGQKIAAMGNTGAQRVMLHFEIRENGKPINPLIYLGRKI